jgi:hypothetical protein
MKPENNFIHSINKFLPLKKLRAVAAVRARTPEARHLHYEKMHNGYRGGTWDAWYSGNSGDLWIEYKWLARVPRRASVKPFELLSPLQLDWGCERLREGRAVAVIVGCPTGGVLLRDEGWMIEYSGEAFTALIQSRKDLAAWILEQTTE